MRPLAIVALLLLVAATATAAVTRSFRQTTAKDFEEGEATASMVLPTGDVVPGMKSSSIALDAAFVWCGALSPDGKTAYFGTGDQGRIYAVDTSATGGKARLLATLEAAWVTALAVRPDGNLIAGTTPGGRVYTIDHKSGEADDADARFLAIEAWMRNLLPDLGKELHRWSGQILDTIDYAAFIGLNPGSKHTYVSTGDSGQASRTAPSPGY